MILALITAQISPACKVMGVGLMELCGLYEGKQVKVDPDLAKYFASKDTDQQEEENTLTLTDCAFCFTVSKSDKSFQQIAYPLPLVLNYVKLNWQWDTFYVPNREELERAYPRGPPVILI